MHTQGPSYELPDHLSVDAFEMAHLVRTKRISPVELVSDTLQAIDALDRKMNAFTVLLEDDAMDAARNAEQAVSDGARLGRLHGVPVSVKDAMWMRGVRTANGSPALRDFVPTQDAVAVQRLRETGAVIVGKTNNPEFCCGGYTGNRLYGLTRNPWDLTRTAGGSSGGAAAAVAAGLTPLSLGGDAGGSIRVPASFCGVVGFKPTFGLIPRGPGFQGWATLGTTGPLCRSARDAALIIPALAGQDATDYMSLPWPRDGLPATLPTLVPGELRIGYSLDLGYATVEPEVADVFQQVIGRLQSSGWPLIPIHPDAGSPLALQSLFGSWEGHAPEGSVIDPHAQSWAGTDHAHELPTPAARQGDYMTGLHQRQEFATAWLRIFDEVDLLITPSVQMPAFDAEAEGPEQINGISMDLDTYEWGEVSFPANLVGMPAISVPCGTDRGGLPIGLQIMGNRFDDARVLQFADSWLKLYAESAWLPTVASASLV